MLNVLDRIRPQRSADESEQSLENEARPEIDYYECPDCNALIISPDGESCSQCESGTLVPRTT